MSDKPCRVELWDSTLSVQQIMRLCGDFSDNVCLASSEGYYVKNNKIFYTEEHGLKLESRLDPNRMIMALRRQET